IRGSVSEGPAGAGMVGQNLATNQLRQQQQQTQQLYRGNGSASWKAINCSCSLWKIIAHRNEHGYLVNLGTYIHSQAEVAAVLGSLIVLNHCLPYYTSFC